MRANVWMKSSEESDFGVYLYTHSEGDLLPKRVQDALKAERRWSDHQYLARIIFCCMIGEDSLNGSTGFGISGQMGDGEKHVLLVDTSKQKVTAWVRDLVVSEWSFKEYIALNDINSLIPGW